MTLWAALLEAQTNAAAITKSGKNQSQGWEFVTVEEVTRVARQALNDAGLIAVLRVPADSAFDPVRLDAYLHVTHPASGEDARFPITWPVERAGPQARRAAYAYARKQTLLELLALSEADPETSAGEMPKKRGRRTETPADDAEKTEVRVPRLQRPQPQQQEHPREDTVITPAQMRLLSALIREWETHERRTLDRQERRRFIAFLAGIDPPDALNSAKDLTKGQATEAIDQLRAHIEQAEQTRQEDGQQVLVEDPPEEVI